MHNNQFVVHQTAEERFWSNVDKTAPNGCWLWTGWKNAQGYGRFISSRKKKVQAYRYAYELLVGPIPAGLQLDHLCRQVACVNPAHLEPVTPRENIMRSPTALAALNARKTECPRGHHLTPDNTYVSGAHRTCATCHRANSAARYRERRSACAS